MRRMLLLFSHELTSDQRVDAAENMGIADFVPLPRRLQELWSNVPASGELESELVNRFTDWISGNSREKDYILVQGDFGLTFVVVEWCLRNGLIPVYSTTERIAHEEHAHDGSVRIIHIFRHAGFRRYAKQ